MSPRQIPPRRNTSLNSETIPIVKPHATVSHGAETLPDDWFDFKPDTGGFLSEVDDLGFVPEKGGEVPDRSDIVAPEIGDAFPGMMEGDLGLEAKFQPEPEPEPEPETEPEPELEFGSELAFEEELEFDDSAPVEKRGKHASVDNVPGAMQGMQLKKPIKAKKTDPEAKKRTGIIIAVVVACLLAVAGIAYAFTSGMMRPSEEQTLVTQDGRKVVLGAETKLIVNADGYGDKATPIFYHIVGLENGSTSGSSVANELVATDVDRYGFIDPTATGDSAAGKGSSSVPEGAFVTIINDLPKGTYSISWSNSFLPDGSYYKVPEDSTFKVAGKDVRLEVTFEKVSGKTASADDVKAAFDALVAWLANIPGDVAQQRDAIVRTARANAEQAVSVAAIGGLDRVGVEEEESFDENEASDASNAASAPTNADTNNGGTNYVAPTYDGGGDAGGNAGGDTGGGGYTPVDPTPVDPTPVDPTPIDPTPIDPTPVDPTPIDPEPIVPIDG